MKVYCSGLDLSDAVLKVAKAIPTKKVIPVLEGIKLSAQGNILTLTATDLELSIEKSINADVKIEGEAVVPGRFFAEFVKKLSNEQIELDTTEKSIIKIKYMDSKGELQCLNADEYPPIKEVNNDIHFTIKEKDFRDIINKTVYCAATDDIRPILKGCLIEINDEKLTAVALDGFRLAVCNKTLPEVSGNASIIVASRSLNEIAKLLEEDEKDIRVYIENNFMMVDLEHTKIITRLMEGEFIQYKKIIPQSFISTVTVNKEFLENGLERASLVSRGDKNNLIKFDVKEKVLTLSSASEIGNIKEAVPVSLEGKDITIAFNARYITEAIRIVNEDFIKINFTTSTSPSTIVPAEGDGYLFLILPVKMIG